jgi:nucleolar complex protein 3
MATIKNALKRFPTLTRFIEEDGRVATGTYSAFMDDPDMCNPFATSLWELSILSV